MVSIIVAVSENNAIGKGNRMPWHIPEDLKYFKRTTTGHPVIMGYNTFLSIGGKPLPGRKNIVVTTRQTPGARDGIEFFNSLQDAIHEAGKGNSEIFIIGGGQLYSSSIDIADRLYITRVDAIIDEADTFFPELDMEKWKESSDSGIVHDEKSGLNLRFTVYDRILHL